MTKRALSPRFSCGLCGFPAPAQAAVSVAVVVVVVSVVLSRVVGFPHASRPNPNFQGWAAGSTTDQTRIFDLGWPVARRPCLAQSGATAGLAPAPLDFSLSAVTSCAFFTQLLLGRDDDDDDERRNTVEGEATPLILLFRPPFPSVFLSVLPRLLLALRCCALLHFALLVRVPAFLVVFRLSLSSLRQR